MDLEAYFSQLSPEEQVLQFGRKSPDPLALAFDRKRVVHAGMKGKMIPPPLAQGVWQKTLQGAPQGRPTQMAYFHIPFCKTKCLYCGFFQNGTSQEAEDRYVDLLIRELEQDAAQPRLQAAPIQAVFIGGGTPTSLAPENARKLLSAIHRCLPLSNDCELTLEGRIHDLVPEKMEVWFAEGVNRMSLGVQSFDTKVRQQVGRIDDQDAVLEKLRALSAWNQCAVVIDLMYGLPDQTLEVWKKDVELLVQSGVDGADLYQLDVFDKSDLALSIQKGRLSPAATTRQQTALFAWGKGYLDAQGWKRLSFCHWTRNNRERSLYNTLARSGVQLFPFGCGAGGHVDGVSTMLHRALPMYERMVSAGQKPLMFLQQESPYARIADRIQAQLNQCRLDLEDLARMDSRLSGLQWLGDLWEEYGLWKHNGYLYHLTEAGQFWEVNMTQTVLECVELLLEGAEKGKVAEARVAEQG